MVSCSREFENFAYKINFLRGVQHLAPHMESDFQTRQGYIKYMSCTLEHLNLLSSPNCSGHNSSVEVDWIFCRKSGDKQRQKYTENL